MKRFFLLLFLVTFFLLYRNKAQIAPLGDPVQPQVISIATTPTPKVYKPIETYNPPKVKPADSYTILFIGDSMTAALGENFDELRKALSKYYPNKVFGLFNYGFGSTNIFSLEDRLLNDSEYLGKTIPAILTRYFDIIIIESFGYNPLSEYTREQGLVHHNETLNRNIAQIVEAKPEALIILMATIAPTKTKYAQGVVDFTPQERMKQAEERIAYIENHIAYAIKHNFPLINVYQKSLNQNGEATLKYINSNDNIHPSAEGVRFISQEIADYFFQNNTLPL